MNNQNQNQNNRTDRERLNEAMHAYEELDFSIKLTIVLCKGIQMIQANDMIDTSLESIIDGAIYQTERLLLRDTKRLEAALYNKID